MQKLIMTIVCMNTLVLSSFWMGRSKYVIPLDKWVGLAANNAALLVGMGAAFGLVWLIFKE